MHFENTPYILTHTHTHTHTYIKTHTFLGFYSRAMVNKLVIYAEGGVRGVTVIIRGSEFGNPD